MKLKKKVPSILEEKKPLRQLQIGHVACLAEHEIAVKILIFRDNELENDAGKCTKYRLVIRTH